MDAALAAVIVAAVNMVGSVLLAWIRAHYGRTDAPITNGHLKECNYDGNKSADPAQLGH